MRPNFLVLGAAKAGTTALHRYLATHPEIFLVPQKDTNFLAWVPDTDDPETLGGEIRQPFPIRTVREWEAQFDGAGAAKAIGEVCTFYFESPAAPRRAQELVPDVRLIAILRNPVDRAYSGYLMNVRLGREARAPEEALTPDSHYVRAGRYGTFMRRWLDRFPPHQIRVHLFEDLRRDAGEVYGDICRFLDVDAAFAPDLATRHNVGGFPRSRLLHRLYTNPALRRTLLPLLPHRVRRVGTRMRARNMAPAEPLSRSVRVRLADIYREENAALSELLDLDLAGWD